jgi:hypothetical protein
MRMFGGGDRSPEEQQKMRAAMEKALGGRNMQDLSREERQAMFAKVREAMGGDASKKGDAAKGAPAGQQPAAGQPGERRGGMRLGRQDSGEMPGGNPLDLLRMTAMASQRFSAQDLENAKLPRPPEEDSGLQALLRPGLLADVEIIVEKIPNALHVPAQAVFDRGGKSVVYVQKGKNFEERPVQLVKRSESIMVLAGGVQAGETIAMADPNAKPGAGKKGEKKSSGGGSPGVPAAGGGK